MPPGGKDGWCVGPATLPLWCADCLKILVINLLQSKEPVEVCVDGLPYLLMRREVTHLPDAKVSKLSSSPNDVAADSLEA